MVKTLELVGITKFYENRKVLDSISLSVDKSRRLVILGPNGSGKTTLLEIIAGIIKPYEGKILIDGTIISEYIKGKRIIDVPPEYRNIGYVPQNYALFPHMSVYDNIAFGLRARKTPKIEEKKIVNNIASLLGIEGLLKRRPSQLSGGQQQRVALARALAIEPQILLMDEPFSNIDAVDRERVRAEISRIVKELDITVITVTHSFADAWSMGDDIAVLIKGRLISVSSKDKLAFGPEDLLVADYLGFNIIRGRVVDIRGEEAIIDIGGQSLTVSIDQERKIMKGDIVMVLFRRDDPVFVNCNENPSVLATGNVIKARMEESFFTKYSFVAKLNVDGQKVIVETGRGVMYLQKVDLSTDKTCIYLNKNTIKILKLY